jgi:glycerophosphoryl diester phosphodiesterase
MVFLQKNNIFAAKLKKVNNFIEIKMDSETMNFLPNFQGHRGARGLLPENTILSFQKAIELGAKALEMDVVVSKDKQMVVSHEPWMSHLTCRFPNGQPVAYCDMYKTGFHLMDYDEIAQYDCGSRGNFYFPHQVPMQAYKPTLEAVIREVDAFCELNGFEKPLYNIEVKSHPRWYGKYVPYPAAYIQLLMTVLQTLPLHRFYISSFDPLFLNTVRRKFPAIRLGYLVDNFNDFKTNCKKLGFLPDIYSPYYRFLTRKKIQKWHHLKVKVATWTVNNAVTMQKLLKMGVDSVITDYPDRMGAEN